MLFVQTLTFLNVFKIEDSLLTIFTMKASVETFVIY